MNRSLAIRMRKVFAHSGLAVFGRDPDRPLPVRVLWSALCLLFVSIVAIFTFYGVNTSPDAFISCAGGTLVSGTNINHAFEVTFFGGLGGAVLIGFVRKRRRLLVSLLALEAVALSAAIGFVALDSATYFVRNASCSLMGPPETHVHHVSGLYVAWGLPLIVLLVQTRRAWRQPRDLSQSEPAHG